MPGPVPGALPDTVLVTVVGSLFDGLPSGLYRFLADGKVAKEAAVKLESGRSDHKFRGKCRAARILGASQLNDNMPKLEGTRSTTSGLRVLISTHYLSVPRPPANIQQLAL